MDDQLISPAVLVACCAAVLMACGVAEKLLERANRRLASVYQTGTGIRAVNQHRGRVCDLIEMMVGVSSLSLLLSYSLTLLLSYSLTLLLSYSLTLLLSYSLTLLLPWWQGSGVTSS